MEVIIRPFRKIKMPDRITHISICPFCKNRNYFVERIKSGGFRSPDMEDFSRCPHYLHATVKKAGLYRRRVAVYTDPPSVSLTDDERDELHRVVK